MKVNMQSNNTSSDMIENYQSSNNSQLDQPNFFSKMKSPEISKLQRFKPLYEKSKLKLKKPSH